MCLNFSIVFRFLFSQNETLTISEQPFDSFVFISLRRTLICDALAVTEWENFLSKFSSSPKFSPDVSHSQTPPSFPPPLEIGNLGFRQFWTQHQKLEHHPPPPPPHLGHREFDVLGSFGLSIKSWKVYLPPPPTWHKGIWVLDIFGLCIKSWKVDLTSPSPNLT